MKNKTIAILLLATTISMSGCGGCSQNTDTTEAVIETESIIETEEPTETEKIAVETETVIETETEEPTERIYHDALIVYADGTYDFTDEYVAEMAQNPFFEGCTEDEVRDYLKSNSTIKSLLQSNPKETVDNYIYGLSEDGQTTYAQLIGRTNSTETEETQSLSKSNNSSSTAESTANNDSSDNIDMSTDQPSNDNSTNYSEGQPITDLDKEMLEHQDDPADWGEYDSNTPSANWQY